MGGTNSKATTNINTFLSQVTTKSITTNKTSCQSTATVNQSVTITDDPYAEAAKCTGICAANPNAPAACYDVCKVLADGAKMSTLTVGNIDQKAEVTLTSSCTVDTTVQNAVKQDVTNAVTQQMAKTGDDVGTALISALSTITKTSDVTTNQNQVSSLVDSTFSVENLQTYVNTVAATQDVLIKATVSTAVLNGITQMASTQAMATMLATNTTLNSVAQAVTNSAVQDLKQTSEVLPGIQAGIASLLGGIGSLISSPFLIIGIVVVLILLGLFFFMK